MPTPVSQAIVSDGYVYHREFERVRIPVDALSIGELHMIRQLSFNKPKFNYLGPNLNQVEVFLRRHGLKKAKVLDALGIIFQYPLYSIEYLPEDEIAKYIKIYTGCEFLFRQVIFTINSTWREKEYSRADTNRQVVLLSCLLHWIKEVDFLGWRPWIGVLCRPAHEPRIILKALQFMGKGTTSLKGGLHVPQLNKPQRKYFFQRILEGAVYQNAWTYSEDGMLYLTTPPQRSFVSDAKSWRRVFQYLHSDDMLAQRGVFPGVHYLYKYYTQPPYHVKFHRNREYNLARFLHRTFGGFQSYSALDPEDGDNRLEAVGEIMGRYILHSLPTCLRDLELLGVGRRHALSCIFKILGESNLHPLEAVQAFEKHKFRAEVGRQIKGKIFEPAPSALRPEELRRIEAWLRDWVIRDGRRLNRDSSNLILLGIYTEKTFEETLERYCQ